MPSNGGAADQAATPRTTWSVDERDQRPGRGDQQRRVPSRRLHARPARRRAPREPQTASARTAWTTRAAASPKCRSQAPSDDLARRPGRGVSAASARSWRDRRSARRPASASRGRSDAEGDHQAEERLAGAAVDGRQERRDLSRPGAAEHSLDDHRHQGDAPRAPSSSAGARSREEPDRQHDRRQADRRAIEPVACARLKTPKGAFQKS